MRAPLIAAHDALRERISNPAQVAPTAPQAEMPSYMGSFCAHLRVLVGVPIEYLVPDARLLPAESIRFFYLDRSWTDRMIDGVISVGKLGTREQGHHQEHGPTITARLDGLEPSVRKLQRGTSSYDAALADASGEAGPVTGLILRSEAVVALRVPLLRLERLTPSILIALFAGVPALVWCEEPHHGVQFGVEVFTGQASVLRRARTGVPEQTGTPVPVPFRAGGLRVVHAAGLRDRLRSAAAGDPQLPAQNGSADFAVEVLNPPWRQRFEGVGGTPEVTGTRVFNAALEVVNLAAAQATATRLQSALAEAPE
jgi:hypothetical protein